MSDFEFEFAKLEEGDNADLVELAKEAGNPTLTSVTFGLGWDPNAAKAAEDGADKDFDLDVSGLVCGADGKVLDKTSFVFHQNKASTTGAVTLDRDNTTGEGEGDDERLNTLLNDLPAEAETVTVIVNIFGAKRKKQHFGHVRNAYVRVVDTSNADADSGTVLARYDLREDFARGSTLGIGQLYRHNGTWKFRALKDDYPSFEQAVSQDYGVNLKDWATNSAQPSS